MGMFGIRHHVEADECQYFVGVDDVVWDWLLADNAVPAERHGKLVVPAPLGYVFNANAVVKHSPAFEGQVYELPGDSALTRNGYVNVGKCDTDKVLMIWRAESDVLSEVEEEEFTALNIDEARIRDIHSFR